ncbi:MAG: hypothetical protein ACJ74U_07010 [Jatrophihabitantaceae bacterium]
MTGPNIEALAERVHTSRTDRGWKAAVGRALLAERLLLATYAWAILRSGVREPLDLLLRGSGAQRLLSVFSDLDYEVSSPAHPHGHADVEAWMAERLAALGIDAEGSTGRPLEADLVDSTGQTRDLHELTELRRAGSPRRDLGWVGDAFADLPMNWWNRVSTYEAHGRHRHAKFAFFEIRALICRLSWRHDVPDGTTTGQLAGLVRVLPTEAANLRTLAVDALSCYETDPHASTSGVEDLQQRMAELRRRQQLAGPDESVVPAYDLRRRAPTARVQRKGTT